MVKTLRELGQGCGATRGDGIDDRLHHCGGGGDIEAGSGHHSAVIGDTDSAEVDGCEHTRILLAASGARPPPGPFVGIAAA